MHTLKRLLAIATVAAAVAACSKSQNNADAPLAFVPADTAFVYANIEPTPEAVTTQWSARMQEYWPAVFGMYQSMLTDTKALGDRNRRIASAVIDEIQQRDTWDKLREIGLKPDMRVAIYGVGMVPVLRAELGDPEKFKAMIARIETKVGEKILTAKTGDQEYWQIGSEALAGIAAIQGNHLVLTIIPTTADDALKQTLLGAIRPQQSLAASGALEALAKEYGYSPYGEGFIDLVKIADRLTSAPTGSDAAFAAALGLPATGTDAVCKSEYLEIAHKFPRIVAGTEELTPKRARIAAQFEMEPVFAKSLAAALGSAPGTGGAGEGIVDLSVAMPVLKLKDFLIAQADAVAAKPYACAQLASLNASFAQSRAKLDMTVPPPFSDLTGMRFTLTKLDMKPGQNVPDFAGKFLMGSSNPLAALAMAQLAVPALKDVKVAPDGKPVALPANLVPMPGVPPMSVALSDKAIAISAGAGEDATLSTYLAAPASSTPQFMRMYFSGAVYGVMARFTDTLQAKLPPEAHSHIGEQAKLFSMYEKWVRSGEIVLEATPSGVLMRETIEMN